MKHSLIKSLGISICCLLIGTVFLSMTYPSELVKVIEKMKQKKYHLKVRMTLFDNGYSKNNILETKEMTVFAFGKYIHYVAGNTENYSDENYQLAIDHENKIILINKAVKEQKKKKSSMTDELMLLELDSAISNSFKITTIQKSTQNVTYKLKYLSEDSEIEFTELDIDTKQSKIKSSSIQYALPLQKLMGSISKDNKSKNKPYLKTEYTTFDYLETFNKDDFDFSKIIKIDKKGDFVLGPLYKNYKVVNYLKVK